MKDLGVYVVSESLLLNLFGVGEVMILTTWIEDLSFARRSLFLYSFKIYFTMVRVISYITADAAWF